MLKKFYSTISTKCIKKSSAYLFPKFFTPQECDYSIEKSENQGFIEAPVGQSQVVKKDIRNNERIILIDKNLADNIYSRLYSLLPKEILDEKIPVSLNDHFRVYKYSPGQRFKPHYDGIVRLPDSESFLTVLIYLNHDYEGGKTRFYERYDSKSYIDVDVQEGDCLVFKHATLHEGTEVTKGIKYVLRSDVMAAKIERSMFD